MSGWNRTTMVEEIPDDRVFWFISDLHLGDGTPSDAFFGKDQHLIALVETVESDPDAMLIIGGDAIDFHQAWSFTRIVRAHQELLAALSRLARQGRLIYVVGNHDYDLSLYREILNFRVCDELHIGDRVLVQHGYQYDPFLEGQLENQTGTKIHHLIERYLDTWLRIPLGEFYTFANRLMFWGVHKIGLLTWAWAQLARPLGFRASADASMRKLDFWARSNMGDPMCIFKPVMQRLRESRWQYIVCGHSHLPGVVPQGDKAYANTGSWTFASSQYLVWDGEQMRCRDWITGREIGPQYYEPLLDGSVDEKDFWQWWRENYMGFLRFREGEERRGRLRGWESYIRDYQHLSQFQPTPVRPDSQRIAPRGEGPGDDEPAGDHEQPAPDEPVDEPVGDRPARPTKAETG